MFRMAMVLLLVIGGHVVSSACECGHVNPGKIPSCATLRSGKEVLFVGTAISTERVGVYQRTPVLRTKFKIDEAIAGDMSDEFYIYSQDTKCDWHFTEHEKYFISAHPWPEVTDFPGTYWVGYCDETRRLSEAEPTLSEYRAQRDGRRFAALYGTLEKKTESDVWNPIPSRTLLLKSTTRLIKATTDERGVFRFYNVPAGEYSMLLERPNGELLVELQKLERHPEITISPHACSRYDLWLEPEHE